MALTLVRTLTRKSNGEHGSSDSGPGPELFLHRSCPRTPAAYPLEFWVSVREEGYAPPFSPVAIPGVPKSDRRPVWRRRQFFLFRPSKILFLDAVRLWSPFASASGSVALS